MNHLSCGLGLFTNSPFLSTVNESMGLADFHSTLRRRKAMCKKQNDQNATVSECLNLVQFPHFLLNGLSITITQLG
jgi:hypothetical protein